MIKSLKIILWNEEIGRLAWDERRRLTYFTYNPDFIKKGLNISPLVAPIDSAKGLLPIKFRNNHNFFTLNSSFITAS